MEDTRTSEEDDDIDSQDSNTPIDHGHLAWNCSMKIITPAVKASVISIWHKLKKYTEQRKCLKKFPFFQLTGMNYQCSISNIMQYSLEGTVLPHSIIFHFINLSAATLYFMQWCDTDKLIYPARGTVLLHEKLDFPSICCQRVDSGCSYPPHDAAGWHGALHDEQIITRQPLSLLLMSVPEFLTSYCGLAASGSQLLNDRVICNDGISLVVDPSCILQRYDLQILHSYNTW